MGFEEGVRPALTAEEEDADEEGRMLAGAYSGGKRERPLWEEEVRRPRQTATVSGVVGWMTRALCCGRGRERSGRGTEVS